MSYFSESDERIDALEFDAPGLAPPAGSSSNTATNLPPQGHRSGPISLATRSGAPWWHSQFNLMLCVFALLAIAASLFIILTPSPTDPNQTSIVVASDGSASLAPATISSAPVTVAPWDESRRAQARSDSQEVLASLLESKKRLEVKKVLEWAPKRFQAALEQANAGDQFYKQQDYAQAIASYTSAAEQMEGLNGLIPEILKSKVRQGLEALDDGKASLAKQRFKEALLLDVNDIGALTGLGRAEVLDDVLVLVSSALDEEQKFNRSDKLAALTAAQEKYQQALVLDNMALPAREGLERIENLASDKEFRVAMSAGYRALFAQRYSTARGAFSKALKSKPNDATANAAYRQSLASDKSSSLGSLLSAAQRYEKNEQWSSALSNYQAVLQRDPNQVSAKLGTIRSGVRNQLDVRLTESLADPLSLAKRTQKERVGKVLSDARGIQKKGPKLKQQIASIELAMQQLNRTIDVTLRSDQLTDIMLLKAGAKPLSLGKFSNRKLALKPGRYVLSGQRLGFQDVRQEVVLSPESPNDGHSFDIRCKRPVTAVNN